MAGKRTILITDCSAQGIGAALALTLAKQGHHVFATAHDISKIPSGVLFLNSRTYASIKAAVNSISETLRLELSPLGVSVVIIMLGTVATPFLANEPTPELPATSYYSAVLDTITKRAKGQAGPKGGPVQQVVDSMIPDVVAEGRNGIVWRGANSTAVWFGSRRVPGRMLVS
ncbi:hypothetical protein ACHAQJ_008074 [Trichoderma viride]